MPPKCNIMAAISEEDAYASNMKNSKYQWRIHRSLLYNQVNFVPADTLAPSGGRVSACTSLTLLNHWGRVTHICVGKPTIIGADNGLSPDRSQAIISINAGIMLIAPLVTHFSEILNGIQTFSFKKMHLKMSSAEWRPFFLGLNVLRNANYVHIGPAPQGQ